MRLYLLWTMALGASALAAWIWLDTVIHAQKGLNRVAGEFSTMKAFGMWSDLPQSDEELLRELGGGWTEARFTDTPTPGVGKEKHGEWNSP